MASSNHPQIYLASGSPRRAELLTQINISFQLVQVNVDESVQSHESVYEYTKRLALEKAQAGFEVVQARDKPVLGADTVVFANDQIIGKPENIEQACDMLSQLSGASHQVVTAVAVTNDVKTTSIVQVNQVTFRKMDLSEIRQYCSTGEPIGKAGAYAIQGRAAVFIEKIEGSYSGVVGLPLFETANLLRMFGVK